MSWRWRLLVVACGLVIGCGGSVSSDGGADAPVIDAPTIDAPSVDATDAFVPVAPDAVCLAGCAQFNDGSSECGVSNYDCDAVCAEAQRIAVGTGCEAETTTFWSCFGAAPTGAYCRAGGACVPEMMALDACVALAPSTDCLRACVLCGDSSYATCALGCARRDGHAHVMGCDAQYQTYYACRIAGPACPPCIAETNAFTGCWRDYCDTHPGDCPVTP